MKRRGLGPAILATMTIGALCVAAAVAWAAPVRPAIDAVGAVGVTVGDLDRSVAFYRDVLSFKVLPNPSGIVWDGIVNIHPGVRWTWSTAAA